jgi:hypothetical protein
MVAFWPGTTDCGEIRTSIGVSGTHRARQHPHNDRKNSVRTNILDGNGTEQTQRAGLRDIDQMRADLLRRRGHTRNGCRRQNGCRRDCDGRVWRGELRPRVRRVRSLDQEPEGGSDARNTACRPLAGIHSHSQ